MTPMAGSPTSNAGTRVVLPPIAKSPAVSSDPDLLLDAFDSYTAGNRRSGGENPDPIEFLNEHYSSEALLVAQLPFIREAVSDRMDRLDDRISTALQRQSESAESTQKHVQDAKSSVASLEKRIKQVQQKASQSEKTVREITKDMKKLDSAKRNLQRTITTLKRLHMLIHAVEQLRLACLLKPHPDYKAASHLVDAIKLLLRHFEAYKKKVTPMRLLSEKVADLQGELRFTLVRGFRIVAFGAEETAEMEKKSKDKPLMILENEDEEEQPNIMTPEVMAGGILMIDALGLDSRTEFIKEFAKDQLLEYTRIYKPVKKVPKEKPRVSSFKAQPELAKEDSKAAFAFEFIEKRFHWFRSLLNRVGEKFPGVFPAYWNVEYFLTMIFLKMTNSHILALLSGPTKDPDAKDPTLLLKGLTKTIQFEKEVSAALQREYGTIFKETGSEESKSPPKTPNSARKDKGKRKGDSLDDGSAMSGNEGESLTKQEPVKPLLGLASSAFDDHMDPYIRLEEQSMDEQLVKALADRTVDTRGELPVFTTSTKLFIYIKGSITRCTALTRGNAFYLIYQAFQDSLRKYAQVLSSKLPPPKPQPGISGAFKGTPVQIISYKVPKGEEVTVCHVIGTCEYCAETVEALEDLIRDKIEDKYKEKVDMMGQQEAFHDITAKAIGVLVSGLENRLEDPFEMMTSTNWSLFEEVGEESDYVRYMHKEIQPYVTTARGLIPTSYFRSFCDKFALAFTTTYYETLLRLKKISEPGTQQLLLDVYNLKTFFLKLPVLEKSEPALASTTARKAAPARSTIAPAMYTKMVQKQFKKIETLLKLTGTPVDLLIDVFKDQWVGGTALDLTTVMSLKGMKRPEQAAMLQKFGLDPKTARKGAAINVTSATIMTERLQDQAAKVNSDLSQMRQKVDEFRKAFR